MTDHPKGENEQVFDAAIREFKDETGMRPNGPHIDLDNIIQIIGIIRIHRRNTEHRCKIY